MLVHIVNCMRDFAENRSGSALGSAGESRMHISHIVIGRGRPLGQAGTAWSGMFEGTMNPCSGNQLLARMELRRDGDRVTRYTFGLGVGKIDGQIGRDGKLYYNWQHAGSLGRGVLEIDPQTAEIRGNWGMGDRREGGGTSRFREVPR
jgi:hypothetical protein